MSASVQVGPPAKTGESRVRRSPTSPSALLSTPADGRVRTVPDVLARSARLYPEKDALGWREVVKVHTEQKEVVKTVQGRRITETKTWETFELSDFRYWTYAQFASKVDDAANGLAALGVTGRSKRFNIFSSTKPAWQLVANACAKRGVTFATAYDSLGPEGLVHSLVEPQVVGVFTNANLVPTLASALERAPTVELVIYDGELDKSGTSAVEGLVQKGVKVSRLEEVLEMGKASGGVVAEGEEVRPEDVACIMYTSGSTGPPKGVMLTHANVVASIAAGEDQLGDILTPDESLIAYLPLAHILEFVIEFIAIHQGMTLGYGTVKTLTSLSVRDCQGDLAAFRPTFMFGVPAVFENIRKGILAKLGSSGPLTRSLFSWAVWLKQSRFGPVRRLVDLVVFDRIKGQLGGRLKYAFSGGASMSPDTQDFLSACLVPVLQGYGLTESTGTAAVLPPRFARSGAVGMPVSSNEIKLVDVAEAGYLTHPDGEGEQGMERGEVWIRGNSVSPGYFGREDLTREAFDDDGWFKTGDIGQFNPDGTLSIIDRKKNLVKLLGGEYVALERLESVYRNCPLVSIVCVHADSTRSRPAAVVVPHEANVRLESEQVGIIAGSFEELCEDGRVKDLVLDRLRQLGKRDGLQPLEIVDSVVLTSDEWTASNGMLTAANKLQRRAVLARYGDELGKA